MAIVTYDVNLQSKAIVTYAVSLQSKAIVTYVIQLNNWLKKSRDSFHQSLEGS